MALVEETETERGEDAAQAQPAPHGKDRAQKPRRDRGLVLVGLFKLAKAIVFGGLGIGALKLLHGNVGDLVMRLTALVPLDPEGRVVSMIMDRADLIGNHQLRQMSAYSLGYAAVCVVEGVGLLCRQVWAEYVTVVLTVIALPWEIFELVKEPTAFRAGLLVLNLLVLAYLLWVIRRRRKQMHAESMRGLQE